jgi:pimeloyl-ACP methyl ester carboxylesterase
LDQSRPAGTNDEEATPLDQFRIAVPDADIADLHRRLDATRWPQAADAGWSEGTDAAYLGDLLRSWRSEFDWRAQEAALNEFEHVKVRCGDVDVHAMRRAGVGPAPLPLILTHGWPSTFAEWRWVVDALADPATHRGDSQDAFDVVAPSLPGYGFSSVPREPGMTPRRIAGLWAELMHRLGYERFAAHGCDWGAYVTALLALDHPEQVVGAHMGMVSLGSPRETGEPTAEELSYRSRVKRWRDEEQGYVAIQSTKPASLAFGLNDSPAGLAAWIAEKWRAWSDCGGVPEAAISRDDLLTAISIYWFTSTIGTASRLYRESKRAPVFLRDGQRVEVPCGFLLERPGDEDGQRGFLDVPRIGAPPRARAEGAFNVQRWTVVDHGGHFPALEIPDVFVEEVRAFFRPLRAGAGTSSR